MSESEAFIAARHLEEATRQAEHDRWHRRVEEWRGNIATPYAEFFTRWRPTWDSAVALIDTAVNARDQQRAKARIAADQLHIVSKLITELTAFWTAVRTWRTADSIGHFGACETGKWLFVWGHPDPCYPSPVDRFGPPIPPADRIAPLEAALVLLRTAMAEPTSAIQSLIESFQSDHDFHGLAGWVRLMSDVLAPPPVAIEPYEWINGLRLPDRPEPAGVRHVVWQVGDYRGVDSVVNALDERLRCGFATAPVMAPGMREVIDQIHGIERQDPLRISLLWENRIDCPETPPLQRVEMAWYDFARKLDERPSAGYDLFSLQLLRKLVRLVRLLVNAGLAERVRSLPDPHVGGRGPAIEMLQLATDIAERYPAELANDRNVREALDAVANDRTAISSLLGIRDEVLSLAPTDEAAVVRSPAAPAYPSAAPKQSDLEKPPASSAPPPPPNGGSTGDTGIDLEERALALAFKNSKWDVARIAKALKVNRTTLYKLPNFLWAMEQSERYRPRQKNAPLPRRGHKTKDGRIESYADDEDE